VLSGILVDQFLPDLQDLARQFRIDETFAVILVFVGS
jgi:hypothetical protein